MYWASSEARNSTALAMSRTSPYRWRGVRAMMSASVQPPEPSLAVFMSVFSQPGATAVTRMLSSAHSMARTLVRARRAVLEVA